jgi:flagellar motor protein MotB
MQSRLRSRVAGFGLGGALALLIAMPVSAQDRPGAADHPLLSRYAGSTLNAWHQEEYAELEIVRAAKPAAGAAHRWGEPVGGRLTAIHYLLPAERTPLEAFRNYQQALAAAGFERLFACELAACDARQINGQSGLASIVIARRFDGRWSTTGPSVEWTDNPSYFLSARLARATGDAYVLLWVTPGFGGGRPGVFEFVLEAKPADTGMVTVNAAALGKGLSADGHVALYGLFFDVGKAEIKPESAAQLKEIAGLLAQQPALRVYVVGHTDNQGSWDSNLALSLRRAEAVVAALVADHKVDAKRLAARGAASMAPVASNRADAGRAKNRRVEIVEQ